MSLDCLACGLELVSVGCEVSDGDDVVCSDCGSRNSVTVDIEYDFDQSFTNVYFGHYTCKHGLHDTEACDQCEIEFGSGVGEP